MTDTEFQAMRQAVVDGDADAAEAAATAAIADGIPPLVAIDEGFMPGMKEVGAGFAAGDLFLPDMMLAARAMQRALAVLEPELKAASVERTRRRPGRHRHRRRATSTRSARTSSG